MTAVAPVTATQGRSAEPVLRVSSLEVRYGDVTALWDVSLEVEPGSIVSIIGSNGAGKTTLLHAISGLARTSSGSITLEGRAIANARPREVVSAGVVQVPEGRHIFPNMSVEENLLVGAQHVRGRAVQTRISEVYSLFPRLIDRKRQPGGTLSGGEQQMLAIGRGLMAGPRLLMLDEPSLGLAPNLIATVFQAIGEIRRRGTTVLLVEQNSRMALRHSDMTYVLESGRVALSGPSSQLLENEDVRRAYFGKAADKR